MLNKKLKSESVSYRSGIRHTFIRCAVALDRMAVDQLSVVYCWAWVTGWGLQGWRGTVY